MIRHLDNILNEIGGFKLTKNDLLDRVERPGLMLKKPDEFYCTKPLKTC